MQQFLPGLLDDPDDDALAQAYAWPGSGDTANPWVRANMVGSLDGRASLDGRSAGLGSDADRRVFQLLRDLAGVILVGAGTVRTENYGGAGLSAQSRDRRSRWGLGDPPPVAVVTSRELDPGSRLFTDTRTAPIVLTTEQGAKRMRELPATVIAAGNDSVDLGLALCRLHERGLTRVHCEGGPALLGQLIAIGRLDELCLTIAPAGVGASAPGIFGPAPDLRSDWQLTTLLRDGSHLFGRYLRQDRSS